MSFPYSMLSAPARWSFLPGYIRATYALLGMRLWAVVRRPVCVNIPGLGRMRLEPWDTIDSRIFFFHVWEPGVTAFMRNAIRPGDIVIDVGANIGYCTLVMSNLVGPEGHVFAVEPCPEIRTRLEAQLALNDITNVTVIPYGISDRNERRSFHLTGGYQGRNLGLSHFGELTAEGGLELRRLSEVVPPDKLSRVNFIKIDVEGMEGPVLRDIITLIPALSRDLCLCAELRMDDSLRAVIKELEEDGFSAVVLPNQYNVFDYPGHPIAPETVGKLPNGQIDVAFRREGCVRRLPSRECRVA